ncbi:tRNA glutamyl-Q(34) synthetase GluQRS [Methylotetracoccus oryzae]|uniref:tRNA glutamyl-Q(34) synthetase GluQRS n=1 Tax=Methylotetracoccus oryzae TaxID=1919059 RepID=UPI001F1B6355|nr:tRNA glutamyl-Q(34) synthetase GluQRS [Methylotetracoccus oryzae]
MGRFAPSPSGPLHLGSLYTALASFLQAKSQGGQWMLRIDDIDPQRSRASAADAILRTLESFGLLWDGEVAFQSRNTGRYAEALTQLQAMSLLFPCTCSRKSLTADADSAVYAGHCRSKTLDGTEGAFALRIRAADTTVSFVDRLQGPFEQNLAADVGDFVVRRRDGVVAYHLATVLDDHEAGITDVMRGIDLLSSTPRQIYLQRLLGLFSPAYCHVPVLVDHQGRKLSKSTRATAVDLRSPGPTLHRLLCWLNQTPPAELAREPVGVIVEWALQHWDPTLLTGRVFIALEDRAPEAL